MSTDMSSNPISSENELELFGLLDNVMVFLPDGKYEKKCPKCKTAPSSNQDWYNSEMTLAGANGYVELKPGAQLFPKHCSNGHWWIPCSPKVYTEGEMEALMKEKLDAGNPQAKIIPGSWQATITATRVATAVDEEYFACNSWKGVSLTREEYYGKKVYNSTLLQVASEAFERKYEKIRRLGEYVDRLKNEIKPSKKERQSASLLKKIRNTSKRGRRGTRRQNK